MSWIIAMIIIKVHISSIIQIGLQGSKKVLAKKYSCYRVSVWIIFIDCIPV